MPSRPPPQLRILVVDDDDYFRKTLTQVLSALGHIVEPASRAKDALAIFEPGKFQLVITDLDMPEMTGDVFAGNIKTASPDQPIIMSTASAVGFSRQSMPNVDYLLSKPFRLEELQHAIGAVTAPNAPTPDRLGRSPSHRPMNIKALMPSGVLAEPTSSSLKENL